MLNNVHRQAREANDARQGLEDKLAAAILKISESERRSQELEAFLAKATERCVMSSDQAAELGREVQILQPKLMVLEQDNSLLRAKLTGVNDALSRMDKDLEELRTVSSRAACAHTAAKYEILKLKVTLQSSTQMLDAQLSNLRDKLQSSEKEVVRLTKTSRALVKENGLLSATTGEALDALYATTAAVCGQNMQECGVGMVARVQDRCKDCTVTLLSAGGPAALSGVLECGDTLHAINDTSIRGMLLSQVQQHIMGPASTLEALAGTHMNSESFSVELVRGMSAHRKSQSVTEVTQSNITTAKSMHKEIAHMSKAYADAQKQLHLLKEEVDYVSKREEALRLLMRGVEQDHVCTWGSLHSRQAECELLKNDLQEFQRRFAAAVDENRRGKASSQEYEATNSRLGKHTAELECALAKQLQVTKDLNANLVLSRMDYNHVTLQRDAALAATQRAQHQIQSLQAQVTNLHAQVEDSQRQLVQAAIA